MKKIQQVRIIENSPTGESHSIKEPVHLVTNDVHIIVKTVQ